MAATWLITGAGRGLGAEIVSAALRAGDRVVAAARDPASIREQFGLNNERLLPVALDVTDPAQAQAAVDAALSRFGAIDVLVNNAGYGQYGFFEESTVDEARDQIATNLLGVLHVTWAVLSLMRLARKGRIFNLSSLGGFIGGELASLYCATKFAVEGFSESLAKEVAPFGIHVTIIEPGPLRTDFLKPRSLRLAAKRISDYDERRAALVAGIEERDGRQPGDPAKLANAILTLADSENPPLRCLAGSFALDAAYQKLGNLRNEFDRWSHLSLTIDGNFDNNASAASLRGQLGQPGEVAGAPAIPH